MAGNTLKAELAERRRRSAALLQLHPQLSRIAELRTPHSVCGCLLWCKVRYGYRCLYCMPPLSMPMELQRLVEQVVEKKWRNPLDEQALSPLSAPGRDTFQNHSMR